MTLSGLGLAAILVSWLGVSLFVLSDGRRGGAAGLLAAGLGLALAAAATTDGLAAASITAMGGIFGALASLRGGDRRGWGVLPPGSTSRIVLCAVMGAAALWFATRLLAEPGEWQSRAAEAIVMALAGARAVSARQIGVALGAGSLVVLAAGVMAGQRGGGSQAVILGAACAVALNLVPWTFRLEREADAVLADG